MTLSISYVISTTITNKTIVFIDEMHLLVGAGAAEGAIDAGNILKPALARGELRQTAALMFAGLAAGESRKNVA